MAVCLSLYAVRCRPTRSRNFSPTPRRSPSAGSDADLSTVYRFGDGGLSPLEGPLDAAAYDRVLDESVIERDGRLYGLTIPLALPVTGGMAEQLGPGKEVALVNSAGEMWPQLQINSVFLWDKMKYLKSVYLTDRTGPSRRRHGAQRDADKSHLLGGSIRVLPQPKDPRFGKYVLTPREVRRLLATKGWQRVSLSRPVTRCTGP